VTTSTDEVLAGLEGITPWQEELYTRLHRHPELSMQETRTAAEIAGELETLGYAVHRVGGGVVGILENGDGPTVLYRADMDALPVEEQTGLPYSSQVPGVMHACGHDVHMAVGMGAAALLARATQAWSGTYVALFQPGEETAEGARAMVADGLADLLPRPDVALGQHVLTSPAAGEVATAPGPVMSTAASVAITVHGRGSHGSMPHLSVDPVLLASSIVVRLQGIVAREVSPDTFAVVTVGSLQAGTKANIIPDRATLRVNVRAYADDVRESLLAAIERVVRAECVASDSPRPPDIEVYDRFPLTLNDDAVTERVTAAFRDRFGAERVRPLAPVTASEDFTVIPDALGAPSCYWGLGGFPAGERTVPNHNPAFAPVMQPTLQTGTEAAVAAALAWLGRP